MRALVVFLLILFLLLTAYPALAREDGVIPENVWSKWNTSGLIMSTILMPLALYLRGTMTYRVSKTRIACFLGGSTALFVALISPLDAMSGSLFSAHMVQHLLLVLVAAPLLVFSRPLPSMLRGIPAGGRRAFGIALQSSAMRRLWNGLRQPITALVLHLASLWAWHIPALYSLAIDMSGFHLLEHASFFLTAGLFWWTMTHSSDYGWRVLAVFIVMMGSGGLGALMTFAQSAWYGDHAAYVGAWGLTLLEDQQLAGLFMWIPAGVVYIVAAALLLSAWLNAVERRTVTREQLRSDQRWVKEMRDA